MLKAFRWVPPALFLLLVPSASPQAIYKDISHGASLTFAIAKGLPPFTFKIISNGRPPDEDGNGESLVTAIEVFRGDAKKPLQQLTGCDLDESSPPPIQSDDWFRAEDFNFDGYKDIYLTTNWGVTGNTGGCIWLFNPKTGHFDYSQELNDLGITGADPKSKTVSTFGNSGAGVWSVDRYAIRNNHPILVWHQDQDFDDKTGKYHCDREERRNGTMVTIFYVDTECPSVF